MLLVATLGLAATGAAVVFWQASYVAQATLLITSQQIPEEFVRSTVREDSIANLNAMVGRVLSREKLAGVIEELNLYPQERERKTALELVSRVRSDAEIGPVGRTGKGDSSIIYSVSFKYQEPDRAADVANALAALFVDASITRRSEQARRATEFLRRELERDERELHEHSQRLSEFRRDYRGVLPAEQESILRRLDLLAQERDSLANQIAETENRIALLRTTPAAVERSENEILLEELRRQLARELAAHTEEHPNVAALRRQIEYQTQVVKDEQGGPTTGAVGQEIAAARNDLNLLRARLAKTEPQIEELNERLERVPAVAQNLAELEQTEQVLREDYQQTLRKVEEAELAESLESAQQGSQVSILDQARTGSPDHSRTTIALAGVAASLALALGIAVLLELIDPVVVNTEQLARLSPSPILGSLPRIS
jgi:uncharacterized protein involved in exopolysaccharide biosynthesis